MFRAHYISIHRSTQMKESILLVQKSKTDRRRRIRLPVDLGRVGFQGFLIKVAFYHKDKDKNNATPLSTDCEADIQIPHWGIKHEMLKDGCSKGFSWSLGHEMITWAIYLVTSWAKYLDMHIVTRVLEMGTSSSILLCWEASWRIKFAHLQRKENPSPQLVNTRYNTVWQVHTYPWTTQISRYFTIHIHTHTHTHTIRWSIVNLNNSTLVAIFIQQWYLSIQTPKTEA